ncbi:hypothetical protein JOF53_005800 [Crossiella equi]|uniref:Uncharacterized protein n=1 Tax=Crossiella equi TaxID=130796 RepID=A0ABS5AK29_9PSEU|nr:hypothetical protein [Crossiella equi]MBP2476928.1 hypothetical protein [Crossiella equi]
MGKVHSSGIGAGDGQRTPARVEQHHVEPLGQVRELPAQLRQQVDDRGGSAGVDHQRAQAGGRVPGGQPGQRQVAAGPARLGVVHGQ